VWCGVVWCGVFLVGSCQCGVVFVVGVGSCWWQYSTSAGSVGILVRDLIRFG
jgi:hypothetical protein